MSELVQDPQQIPSPGVEPVYSYEIPQDVVLIKQDCFEGVDLATFYYQIFGLAQKHSQQTDKTFYISYIENLGNLNMEIVKSLDREPPGYLKVVEQFSIECDMSMDTGSRISEKPIAWLNFKFVHPIKAKIGPK